MTTRLLFVLLSSPFLLVGCAQQPQPTSEQKALLAPPTEASLLKRIEDARNDPHASEAERKANVAAWEKELEDLRKTNKK